jgi:Flp pilus assembly protein TadG
VTLYGLVLAIAMIALVALVVDGGAKLRAARQATGIAEEAARAGAGQADLPTAYSQGVYRIDRLAAIGAAQDYLAATGHRGSVRVTGATTVEVTVRIEQPTLMLSLAGITSISVQGTAQAHLVTGVTGPAR